MGDGIPNNSKYDCCFNAFDKIIIVCTKQLTVYNVDKTQLSQTNPRDGKATSGQSSLTKGRIAYSNGSLTRVAPICTHVGAYVMHGSMGPHESIPLPFMCHLNRFSRFAGLAGVPNSTNRQTHRQHGCATCVAIGRICAIRAMRPNN